MIVCHCRAVSDRTIRASVREGACTLDAVAAETGASTCCGGCEPTVSHILDEELGTAARVTASGDSAVRSATLRPLRIARDAA